MSSNGIPTDYRHFRFRSRLEATWARFFDAIGWTWKYEPFDYDGYIPDFAIILPAGNVLVEVKPCLTLAEMPEHIEKIDRSPWKGEALILGIGILRSHSGWDNQLGLHGSFDFGPEDRVWEPAIIHRCLDHIGFHAAFAGCWCRYAGKENCDHHSHDTSVEWFDEQWALAQNLVQWSPRVFGFDRAAL